MNNFYYLPVPSPYQSYTYYQPAMYSTLPTLQCQESCCGTPAMYAPLSSAYVATGCTDTCCSWENDIIINNPGNNPVYINNPGPAACNEACCSTTASSCNLSCCSGYEMPMYEDTCNTSYSYYRSDGPAGARYKETPKSYYNSYGKGGNMMM